MTMSRSPIDQGVALTTAIGTTAKIPMGNHAGGMIFVDTDSSITSLTYYAAPRNDDDSVFEPLVDSAGNAVTRTIAADNAMPFPDECFAAAVIKIVVDAADTVQICLKS